MAKLSNEELRARERFAVRDEVIAIAARVAAGMLSNASTCDMSANDVCKLSVRSAVLILECADQWAEFGEIIDG